MGPIMGSLKGLICQVGKLENDGSGKPLHSPKPNIHHLGNPQLGVAFQTLFRYHHEDPCGRSGIGILSESCETP